MYQSYIIGALRGVPAFPLYASFVRDHRRAAATAASPAACLRTGQAAAPDLRRADCGSGNSVNVRNPKAAQPIGGTISKRYQALCRKRRERRKPRAPLTAVHAPAGGFSGGRFARDDGARECRTGERCSRIGTGSGRCRCCRARCSARRPSCRCRAPPTTSTAWRHPDRSWRSRPASGRQRA
jgi:hypothetical protein